MRVTMGMAKGTYYSLYFCITQDIYLNSDIPFRRFLLPKLLVWTLYAWFIGIHFEHFLWNSTGIWVHLLNDPVYLCSQPTWVTKNLFKGCSSSSFKFVTCEAKSLVLVEVLLIFMSWVLEMVTLNVCPSWSCKTASGRFKSSTFCFLLGHEAMTLILLESFFHCVLVLQDVQLWTDVCIVVIRGSCSNSLYGSSLLLVWLYLCFFPLWDYHWLDSTVHLFGRA